MATNVSLQRWRFFLILTMKPAVCFAVFAGIPFVIAAGPPGRLIIIIFVPTLPVLLGDTNYTNYSLRYRHQERSAGSRPRVFCGRSRGRKFPILHEKTTARAVGEADEPDLRSQGRARYVPPFIVSDWVTATKRRSHTWCLLTHPQPFAGTCKNSRARGGRWLRSTALRHLFPRRPFVQRRRPRKMTARIRDRLLIFSKRSEHEDRNIM